MADQSQTSSAEACPRCRGAKVISVTTTEHGKPVTKDQQCPDCRGTGKKGYWTK